MAGRIPVEPRRSDSVARIGGGGFAILLTHVKRDDEVAEVAEKLLASVAKTYLVEGQHAQISASIGIAMFPDEGEDLQSLLVKSDAAMYESKRRGKNTYTLSKGDSTEFG